MSDFISNFFGQQKPVRKSKTAKRAQKRVQKSTKTTKPKVTKKPKEVITFKGIKKSKVEGKKYDATFIRNGREKVVSFGKKGEKDYTQHKDREMKEFFDFKYKKKQNWKDLMNPQALNKWILWDKNSLEKGVKSYEKMFKEKYNK